MFGIIGRISLLAVPVLALGAAAAPSQDGLMQSLTPIIFVDRVGSCMGFWEQLGFERTSEVPGDGGGLVFAALKSGGVEVMYQTRASLADDMPSLVDQSYGPSFLYVQVEELKAVQAKLDGAGGEVIVDERQTFYGARETTVRAPCGTVVTFAEFG